MAFSRVTTIGALFGTLAFALPQASDYYGSPDPISVPECPPPNAGVPLESFMSYSIEFSSFPDFAGNLTSPNTFSDNLLSNIAKYAGSKPHIRVGGNTQDFPFFDESLEVAFVGVFNETLSADYPTTLTIGPAYFESYLTWPHTKYVHGFNLGKNSSSFRASLLKSVPYACKALGDGRLLNWELGNEPDLFREQSVRANTWDESEYVQEWLFWTRAIRAELEKSCPELGHPEWYAPSFAGTGNNSLDPSTAWAAGLDEDKNIPIISSHNYISGAMTPGVTLQGTLMNHTSSVESIAKQLNASRLLHNLAPGTPFILGEHNSLFRQGRPGLSNTFGAALWAVDFNLLCAANNIRRVHMHMGTNYRYQSWQPIDTDKDSIGTKAPYYGNVAVAAFLGDLTCSAPSIINIPLPTELEAAYAAYEEGELRSMIVINLNAYNATDYNTEYITGFPRPLQTYSFDLGASSAGKEISLQRLIANGSDAISGITYDGYSYNYELDEGKPVLLQNVTRGETVAVDGNGKVRVEVPWSSAVVMKF
ncbi:unnamed protein product [Zymoseptoria tritici ST99CH_3D1]|nr:unnamed protein product [Zymoseptoria tritici ST99CH_3D1]